MTNTICLDEKYSTTRLLCKIVNDECLMLNRDEDNSKLFLPIGENRKGEGGLRTKGYFKKSYEDKPLISIITVVYNGEKYLEETIQSVINQTYHNVEYIIIDGGSTDGTLDIIKKYDDKLDYWVSERDKGISDAFNKSIRVSNGYKLLMLNCGDTLIDFNIVLNNIDKIAEAVDVTFFTVSVNVLTTIPSKKVKNNIDLILSNVEIPHQGAFVKKSAYNRFGLYNENFKIRMDYEFFSRLLENNCSFQYHDIEIVKYLQGGVSMQLKNRFLFIVEAMISDYMYKKINLEMPIKQKLKKIISVTYLIFKGKL